MAAVCRCDWSSKICFVRWALGASWACTPSTFLKRKQRGWKEKKGEKKSDKQTREFGFKRHKKKKKHSQIQRNGHRTGVNLTRVQLKR